jgi:hypothetical protein
LPSTKPNQFPLTLKFSKYFGYLLQHHGVEVFPYQDREEDKELKRRRVEGKTRRKRRQGVDDQKIKRRETKSRR